MDPHTQVTATERAEQKLRILQMLTADQGWAATPEGDSFSERQRQPHKLQLQTWHKRNRESRKAERLLGQEELWGCRLTRLPPPHLGQTWPVPTISAPSASSLHCIAHLDGSEVLEVPVRMWDEAHGAVPLGGGVNPKLILLIRGQEPGSIRTEAS